MNFIEKLRGALYSKTSNAALAVILIGVVFWVLRWATSVPLESK